METTGTDPVRNTITTHIDKLGEMTKPKWGEKDNSGPLSNKGYVIGF